MSYFSALLLSATTIIAGHGYLLAKQKATRKPTVSEHAVLHKKSFAVYVLAHILGGGFFLIFAKKYYLDIANLGWLFKLTIFTVLFEYIQAVVPAKGTTKKLHTITALTMWLSLIVLGLLSIIFAPTPAMQRLVASILYIGIFCSLIYALSHRHKMYLQQMIMVSLFFAAMTLLVI